jgi:hypothetical protein
MKGGGRGGELTAPLLSTLYLDVDNPIGPVKGFSLL